MKRRLVQFTEKDQTLNFKINKTDINQSDAFIYHKEDSELEICGKMHDIVSIDEERDTIVFHCITDKKETELKRKLNNWLMFFFSRSIAGKFHLLKILGFLNSLFVNEFWIDIPKFNWRESENPNFLYIASYSNHISKVLTPPPCFIQYDFTSKI